MTSNANESSENHANYGLKYLNIQSKKKVRESFEFEKDG